MIALLLAFTLADETLENEWVKVTVDPSKGGAVTSMVYKKATTFPLIAGQGAGIAGRGTYFSLGPAVAMRTERVDQGLRLSGTLEPGVAVERTILMARDESGFRITDRYASDMDRVATIGSESRQGAETWRVVARSYAGDDKARPSWRMIAPLGVGFLYEAAAPAGAKVTHAILKDAGTPVEFRWQCAGVPLSPGKPLVVESSVLIDEGGGQNRVTVDLRAAGKSGEALPGHVTVVSATPRKATLVLRNATPAEVSLDLQPGRAQMRLFEATPAARGMLEVTAELRDEKGQVIARGTRQAVIDGEGKAWDQYLRKIPNETFKGTWSEIGAQLAKTGKLKPKAADARAGERLAFYEKKFPYYADLLKGAAGVLQVKAEQLSQADPTVLTDACMNVLFVGPDGPVNAFSKERTGAGLGGLAYIRIIPDKGYRYHIYTMPPGWFHGYGVNSEGLSTSGASINCDDATTTVGRRELQEWKAAGKHVAPVGVHMMMATCRNVDEAIAFIENAEAPFEFEGNMMLVDRSGKAARLESVGIRRQIQRYDPAKDTFFVAGNYPHESREGLFKIGPDWGWAANTMLRERLLEDLAGPRQGKLAFKDAVALMETHAAGGMCQHIVDNVGRLYTSNSYLAVPRTSDLWLSQGPPCQFRYYRFSLNDGE